jgi:two-component system KDP operon response regulator KdpE
MPVLYLFKYNKYKLKSVVKRKSIIYLMAGRWTMAEAGKKKRVLVVDDHDKVLAFIQIDLKLRGFEVITGGSGKEALDLIRTKKPDILLLDMVMPGIDGFEVLKEMRTFTKMPVIAFSASPGNQDPAMQAGANDFVHKPFDPDDMAKRITALLSSVK